MDFNLRDTVHWYSKCPRSNRWADPSLYAKWYRPHGLATISSSQSARCCLVFSSSWKYVTDYISTGYIVYMITYR